MKRRRETTTPPHTHTHIGCRNYNTHTYTHWLQYQGKYPPKYQDSCHERVCDVTLGNIDNWQQKHSQNLNLIHNSPSNLSHKRLLSNNSRKWNVVYRIKYYLSSDVHYARSKSGTLFPQLQQNSYCISRMSGIPWTLFGLKRKEMCLNAWTNPFLWKRGTVITPAIAHINQLFARRPLCLWCRVTNRE